VHTLWYVVVAPPAEAEGAPAAFGEGAAAGAVVTAQGFVAAAATGNRLRSLGVAGHACFCWDTHPCCTWPHKNISFVSQIYEYKLMQLLMLVFLVNKSTNK